MRSKGHVLSRIASIVRRYAVCAKPMAAVLLDFAQFAQKMGFRPSFPVTAAVVARHPSLFRKLQNLNAELGVHGYRHIDYAYHDTERSLFHHRKSVQIFRDTGIGFTGFRFPFLKRNHEQIRLLSQSGFVWDSSEVISWAFERPKSVTLNDWQNYLAILQSYHPLTSDCGLALPRHDFGFIEIPVSVPDDDILIERLHLTQSEIKTIWGQILHQTHTRGECFVIQLHPERFPFFKSTLKHLILSARKTGTVWIASLGEIADWWRRKSEFRCHVVKKRQNVWEIRAENNEGGTLLGMNIPDAKQKDYFWKNWQVLPDAFLISHPRKPVIGLPLDAPETLKIFLADEGYLFELTASPDNYGVYLDHYRSIDETVKPKILMQIEKSENPLIRFWRWPWPNVSCFSVTGDIDGVDIWDYWSRFYGI